MFAELFISLIAFELTSGSVFDGLFSAQLIAKRDFDTRIVNSTKLNIAFEYPKDKISETLDFTFKTQLIHTFGSIIDQSIDDLIDVSQQSIDALLQFQNLLNEMLQNFRDLSKIREYDIHDDKLDKINNLNDKVVNKWNDFLEKYRKIEQNLEKNNILVFVEKNFYESIDHQTVIDLANQFSNENNPLIEVLFVISEYKSQIIDKLVEYNSKDVNNYMYSNISIIQTISCELENLLKHNMNVEQIKQFIKSKVPQNYQNKLIIALLSGGIDALKSVLKNLCQSNSESMAFIIINLTDNLPITNLSDYKKQYQLFQFIQWVDSVARDGLSTGSNKSVVRDSAEQLMKTIKVFNENTLNQSLDEFKAFGQRFQQILEKIETQLNQISKNFII